MIQLAIDQSSLKEGDRIDLDLLDSFKHSVNDEAGGIADGEISVAFIGDGEIKRLNRMYRNKDSVTDVLSFSYMNEKRVNNLLGDVVISMEQAKRQAEDGDIELELIDLMAHGILHVLGFDHEIDQEATQMFKKQDAIVKNVL